VALAHGRAVFELTCKDTAAGQAEEVAGFCENPVQRKNPE
jgi:hypothetical protein